MKKTILSAIILLALAGCKTTGTNQIQSSKADDARMSCLEIVEEIQEMDKLIADVEQQKASAHATNVGTAVGGHAVSMSGVPLLGAAISHAGSLSNMNAAERDEMARQAEMRKSALRGLYMGKDCAE